MKNIQKKFALLLALALLTSLLGACGDGAASSAASTAEAPAVSEEAAAPATEAPQPEIETGSAETVSAQEPADEAPAAPGAHKSIADAAPEQLIRNADLARFKRLGIVLHGETLRFFGGCRLTSADLVV